MKTAAAGVSGPAPTATTQEPGGRLRDFYEDPAVPASSGPDRARRQAGMLARVLASCPAGPILDVGCGDGARHQLAAQPQPRAPVRRAGLVGRLARPGPRRGLTVLRAGVEPRGLPIRSACRRRRDHERAHRAPGRPRLGARRGAPGAQARRLAAAVHPEPGRLVQPRPARARRPAALLRGQPRGVYGRPGSQVAGHLHMFTSRALVGLLAARGFSRPGRGCALPRRAGAAAPADRRSARWPAAASILLVQARKDDHDRLAPRARPRPPGARPRAARARHSSPAATRRHTVRPDRIATQLTARATRPPDAPPEPSRRNGTQLTARATRRPANPADRNATQLTARANPGRRFPPALASPPGCARMRGPRWPGWCSACSRSGPRSAAASCSATTWCSCPAPPFSAAPTRADRRPAARRAERCRRRRGVAAASRPTSCRSSSCWLIFVLACSGAAALLPTAGGARAAPPRCRPGWRPVSSYAWNPYLAERLMMGQWALLLGYAGLPWVLRLICAARPGRIGPGPAGCALLIPAAIGGFAAMAITGLAARAGRAVPAAAGRRAGGAARARDRARLRGVLSLPWLIPSLMSPVHADPAARRVRGQGGHAVRRAGQPASCCRASGTPRRSRAATAAWLVACWLLVVAAALAGYLLLARAGGWPRASGSPAWPGWWSPRSA